MANGGGLGTGILEGLQGVQQLQMGQLGMEEKGIDIATKEIALQRQQKFLAALDAMIQRGQQRAQGTTSQSSPSMGSSVGADRSGIPNQAVDMAEQYANANFAIADAAFSAGLPDEYMKASQAGVSMLEGVAKIQMNQANAAEKTAKFAEAQARWVKDAPQGSAERNTRWQQALFNFQTFTGKQSPYVGQVPDDRLLDGIIRNTATVSEDAKNMRNIAAAKASDAQAAANRSLVEYRNMLAGREPLVREHLRRLGTGAFSPMEMRHVENVENAINTIDDMQSIMAANPSMTFTGKIGEAHAYWERIHGLWHSGYKPAVEFQQKNDLLLTQVDQAINRAARGSKQDIAIAKKLSDAYGLLTTGDVGAQNLQTLRESLQSILENSPAYKYYMTPQDPELEKMLRETEGAAGTQSTEPLDPGAPEDEKEKSTDDDTAEAR